MEELLADIVVNAAVGGNPESTRTESIKTLIHEIMNDDSPKAYDIGQLNSRIMAALTGDELWSDNLTESLLDINAEETSDRLAKDLNTLHSHRRLARFDKVLRDASYNLHCGKVPYGEMIDYAKDVILGLETIHKIFNFI